MNAIRSFQQKLAKAFRFREKNEYDAALRLVDDLRKDWPGNAQLHLLWAGLVQLQENTEHTLDEAKQALQRAIVLEKDYPEGYIELGYFQHNVEDNPKAALPSFSEGVRLARHLLIDGLLGQAKAFAQLEKREEALKCILESVYLANIAYSGGDQPEGRMPDVLIQDSSGRMIVIKEQIADKVKDLLQELFPKRSA